MFIANVGNIPGDKGIPDDNKNIVSKNIIPSLGSTFNRAKRINPLLSSVEVNRTYNIGTILAKAFYDFNNKRKVDVKPSTIASTSKATVRQGNKVQVPKNTSSILSTVATIIALAVLVYKFLGPVGVFASKFALKIFNVIKWIKTTKFASMIEGFFTNISKQIKSIFSIFTESKIVKQITAIKPGIFKKIFKGISSFVGKKLGFLFKRLPLVGSLISFTYAYMRLKEGKYFTGILEILSGIANLVPGPGTAISLAIDGVILLSDLLSSGDMAAKTSSVIHGAKLAGKSLFKILTKTALKLGTKLLKVLKFIPFIGGVAGLALAYMRFKDGDWIAGTVELVSAIADFIPGVGNIVSLILDGGLLLYDILRSNKKTEDTKQSTSGSGFSFTDVAKKIGGPLLKGLWYVPGISGLLYIGRGVSKFIKGDFKGGIKDLGLSIIGFVGGKGLVDLLSYTLGLFTNKKTENKEITAKKVSFADIISKGIAVMLDTLGNLYNNIVNWAKKRIDSVKEGLSKANEKYNPVVKAWEFFTGHDKKMEDYEKENQRLSALGRESYRKSQERNKKPIDKEWDKKRRERLGPAVHDRIRERERKIGKYSEFDKKSILPPVVPYTKSQIITQPAAENIKTSIVNSKQEVVDLSEQNKLIMDQNQLLMQLLTTAKEQLITTKKQKPNVTVAPNKESSTNVNSSNAFSTNRQDGRSMYMSSPYSISPSFA
jgi:hypothetical protein